MKIGKHTADYLSLIPGPLGKAAKLAANLRRQREVDNKHRELVDAFRSRTSHNGNTNDND